MGSMKNGKPLLSGLEVNSGWRKPFTAMSEIESKYEARYFLVSMEEIKAQATDEVMRIRAQNDRGTREDTIVDLWQLMIQT